MARHAIVSPYHPSSRRSMTRRLAESRRAIAIQHAQRIPAHAACARAPASAPHVPCACACTHTCMHSLSLCSRPTPRNCHRAEHDAAMTDPRNAVSRAIAAPPSPTRDPIVRPHRLHTDCATGRARARDGRRQQCSHTSTATGSSSAIDGGRRATGAAESHGSKVSPLPPRPCSPPSPSSSPLSSRTEQR